MATWSRIAGFEHWPAIVICKGSETPQNPLTTTGRDWQADQLQRRRILRIVDFRKPYLTAKKLVNVPGELSARGLVAALNAVVILWVRAQLFAQVCDRQLALFPGSLERRIHAPIVTAE